MIIFNIIPQPENYEIFPINSATAGVYLRTKIFHFKDEKYITLKITLPSTDEHILTGYMTRYRDSYFVVEDETIITQMNSDKGNIGKYLDLDVVGKQIKSIIKPFEYSGNKDLIFKRGGWGELHYDEKKKQIKINVKIDSSQLGNLPHKDSIE